MRRSPSRTSDHDVPDPRVPSPRHLPAQTIESFVLRAVGAAGSDCDALLLLGLLALVETVTTSLADLKSTDPA